MLKKVFGKRGNKNQKSSSKKSSKEIQQHPQEQQRQQQRQEEQHQQQQLQRPRQVPPITHKESWRRSKKMALEGGATNIAPATATTGSLKSGKSSVSGRSVSSSASASASPSAIEDETQANLSHTYRKAGSPIGAKVLPTRGGSIHTPVTADMSPGSSDSESGSESGSDSDSYHSDDKNENNDKRTPTKSGQSANHSSRMATSTTSTTLSSKFTVKTFDDLETVDAEEEEAEQMKQLAESLGLPPAFFGIRNGPLGKSPNKLQEQQQQASSPQASKTDQEEDGSSTNKNAKSNNSIHTNPDILQQDTPIKREGLQSMETLPEKVELEHQQKTQQEQEEIGTEQRSISEAPAQAPAPPLSSPAPQQQHHQQLPTTRNHVSPTMGTTSSSDGMQGTPTTSASSKIQFIPHPTTVEEKRKSKEDAMSRLNRIKAKAVKSATKHLGVDATHLSYAVGLDQKGGKKNINTNNNNSNDPTTTIITSERYSNNNNVDVSDMGDPQDLQAIADALGLPIEMFGVQQTKSNTKAKTKANANASTLSKDTQLKDENISEVPAKADQYPNDAKIGRSLPTTTTTTTTKSSSSRSPSPQPGSLAAALGMIVDDSDEAPSIRQGNIPSQKLAKDANASTATEQGLTDVMIKPGSLAEALGVKVNSSSSSSSPPTLSKTSKTAGTTSSTHIQAGSLAAALGIQGKPDTDPKADVPSSFNDKQDILEQKQKGSMVGMPKSGSLAEALGMKVIPFTMEDNDEGTDNEDDSESTDNSDTSQEGSQSMDTHPSGDLSMANNTPQLGSLADALGVKVALQETLPTSKRQQAYSHQIEDATLMGTVFGNVIQNVKASSSLSSSTASRKSKGTQQRVQSGSLAEALGMKAVVDDTENYQSLQTIGKEDKLSSMPMDGSLAAALGMRVVSDTTSSVGSTTNGSKKKKSSRKMGIPAEGSLAAALGMTVRNDESASQEKPKQETQPSIVQGSLAAALGMRCIENTKTSSSNSEDKFQVITKVPPVGPSPGSLAAALGMVISDDQEVVKDTEQPRSVQAGSLAAALGIPIHSEGKKQNKSKDNMNTRPPLPTSTTQKVGKPQVGSLAEALGMQIDDSNTARNASASPSIGSRGASAEELLSSPPPTTPTRSSSSASVSALGPGDSPYTVVPATDSEIRLRMELAAAQSKVMAATAYSKSLEEQMSQMATAYSQKLSSMQSRMISLEEQIVALEDEKMELEEERQQQQQQQKNTMSSSASPRGLSSMGSMDTEEQEDIYAAQEALMERLCQAGERMSRARGLMEEMDAIFQEEVRDIHAIKAEYDAGLTGEEGDDDDDTDDDYDSRSSSESSSRRRRSQGSSPKSKNSGINQNLHQRLERENDRRQGIKNRLKAMQQNK